MTTPQQLLTFQRIALGLFWVIPPLAGILAALVIVGLPLSFWPASALLLTLLGAVVSLLPAVFITINGQVQNLQAHIVDAVNHRCQCPLCGSDLQQTGPMQVTRNVMTPQEKASRANGLVYTGAIQLAVGAIVLILGFVFKNAYVEPGMPMGWPMTALIAPGILMPLGGIFVAVNLHAKQRLARPAPHHTCTCRWCGAPGMPVQ